MEMKVEDGKMLVKVGDEWQPMPESLIKRIAAAESPSDLIPVAPSPVYGMTPVAVFPGSGDPPLQTRTVANPELALFRKKTGCDPIEYIERLVEGTILERGDRVTNLYKIACKLLGRDENPLELI